MIEVPEAAVLAQQIERTLKGRRITDAEANHTPHRFAWYTGDPATYREKLVGKVVTGARATGGSVMTTVEDTVLLISTPIRYHERGDTVPEKRQLLVGFEDGSSITCTVQMWGGMFCYRDGDDRPSRDFLNPAPSPLDDRFDRAHFDSLLVPMDPKSTSAKAFLATEQRIPGLGNGVLQDILWTAGVHPKRKMSTLSEADRSRLYDAAKTVIAKMVAQGGRDTERDLFGNWGGYKTILSKNTVDRPCPSCGSIIRKEAYLGGAVYYCEGCQKI